MAVQQGQDRIKEALGLARTDELGPLLGNDLVAAKAANRPLAAWVVKDEPALRAILSSQVTRHRLAKRAPSGGYERYARPGWSVAVKGPVVVVGDPVSVAAALQDRARGAGMTRRLFEERLRGLPMDSLLRFEANAALIGAAQRSKVAWLRALGRVALTVRADSAGLHGHLRAASAPVALDDLPLAPGATAPVPLARANGATVGIRDLRHVIRFGLRTLKATDPGAYRRYDLARRGLKLVRRGDIDRDVIDQLGGTATVWSPDLHALALTAPVGDPARMARALKGLRPLIGRLLDAAGLPGARYGVTGSTFVLTTAPGYSLAQLAAGRPQRIGSAPGALAGVIRAGALRQLLIDRLGLPPIASLALGALGDATFAVRTATTGVDAVVDVSIR